MITIGIRADGGPSIGLGHIMRCLSLAKELRKNGYQVYFLSKIREGIEKIQKENFEVIKIGSNEEIKNRNGFCYGDLNSLEEESAEIIDVIRKIGLDLLIIDSYNVSEQYFLSLKPHLKKLIYLDDLNKFVYPVDILINGNLTACYLSYRKYSPEEILLLGPKYNLIREEFRGLPKRTVKPEVKEIMLTTGGSDPYNMSVKILDMLLQEEATKDLIVNVVVGSSFTNQEELINKLKRHSNIILHFNPEKMSTLMLRSDIAISAGGSTLYELCACGTPTLAFISADNQEFIVNKMDELGYIRSIGWHHSLDRHKLIKYLLELKNDFQLRNSYKNKQQQLVDARGSTRIVQVINKVMGQGC